MKNQSSQKPIIRAYDVWYWFALVYLAAAGLGLLIFVFNLALGRVARDQIAGGFQLIGVFAGIGSLLLGIILVVRRHERQRIEAILERPLARWPQAASEEHWRAIVERYRAEWRKSATRGPVVVVVLVAASCGLLWFSDGSLFVIAAAIFLFAVAFVGGLLQQYLTYERMTRVTLPIAIVGQTGIYVDSAGLVAFDKPFATVNFPAQSGKAVLIQKSPVTFGPAFDNDLRQELFEQGWGTMDVVSTAPRSAFQTKFVWVNPMSVFVPPDRQREVQEIIASIHAGRA